MMDTMVYTNGVNHKSKYLNRMLVESGSALKVLYMSDVQWIEASGNYINLVSNGKSYLIRETLTGFLKKLDPKQFSQIHRSTIVNINYIDRFEEMAYGDYSVILKNGSELKMTRNFKQLLRQI